MSTTLLADFQIRELVKSHNMIENFVEKQKQTGVLSYGLDGFGYDIRVQDCYRVPDYYARQGINMEIDPKRIVDVLLPDKRYANNEFALMQDRVADAGKIRIAPNSFVQVVSVEKFNMPNNVIALSPFGKSTYGRFAIFPIITPIDAGYSGYITFAVLNPHPIPCVIYANEGLAQIQFYQSELSAETSYADKGGKYQGSEGIQGSKIKE